MPASEASHVILVSPKGMLPEFKTPSLASAAINRPTANSTPTLMNVVRRAFVFFIT
jgi:hypothetical protein